MSDISIKVGIFYGSTTCYTEMAAQKIKTCFESNLSGFSIDTYNVADTPIKECQQYDYLIFGIPTWDFGELQEDWDDCWDDMDSLSFENKLISIYGLGDQIGYPDWFQDAMGYLHNKVLLLGGTLTGYWPNKGYSFTESKALTNDHSHFVGLPLDEENQFDLTEDRINQWCQQLISEWKQALD